MTDELQKTVRQGLGGEFAVKRYDHPTLGALEGLWASMPGGPISTAFQSPQLLDSVQAERKGGADRAFSVFSICRQDNKQPLMLVPVMTIDRGPFKVATMADLDVVDVNAPILAKDQHIHESEYDSILNALFEQLTDADLFDAINLPEKICGLDNPFFRSSRMEIAKEALRIPLDDEHLCAQRRKKSIFREAKRKGRRLAEQGVEFSEVKAPSECEDVLQTLLTYKRRRLRAAGITRDPWNENQERFFKRAVTSQSKTFGRASLQVLKRNDEIVAAALAFVSDYEIHGAIITMGESDWDKYSPGSVLICKSIEWAEEHGLRHYYLGPGAHSYKNHFGAQTYALGRILAPLSAKGRSYMALKTLKDTGAQLFHAIKPGNVLKGNAA